MVIFGSLLIIGLLVFGTLSFLGQVSKLLRGLIAELRHEREMVGLQKQIIGLTAEQISIQRSMIDKKIEMVTNGLTVMKLMADRKDDPAWMKKFDEGRENAQYN